MSGSKRGWCPSLHRPMQSGDGLLMRVKPYSATLPARDVRTLARAAKLFGNGTLGLTSRGNLQFRGFTERSAEGFAGIVMALSLAETEASAEARRSVVVSPLHGLDPECHMATHILAQALEQMLARHDDWTALGSKFCVAVDGGGAMPVAAVPCDLLLQPVGAEVLISPTGHSTAARVSLENAISVIDRLITRMLAHSERMRDTDAEALFAAEGLHLDSERLATATPLRAGKVPGGFAVSALAGLLQVDTLHHLADLAEAFGDGTLRVSPYRALILPGVAHQPATLPQDLLTTATDQALHAHACPGAPFCASASVATQADLRALLGRISPWQGELHLSGCAKGCAHPAPAEIVLTGEAGRYNLIRNARADASPIATNLTLEDAARLLTEGRTA